jgi:2-(3-amino-3-carboxypropyl)histidine synthase
MTIPLSRWVVICLSTTATVVSVSSTPGIFSNGLFLFAVPMDQTTIKTLYVFVEISIDSAHLLQSVRLNFPSDRKRFHDTLLASEDSNSKIPTGRTIGKSKHLMVEGPVPPSTSTNPPDSEPSRSGQPTRLALVSTIQFVAALQRLKEDLSIDFIKMQDPGLPRLLQQGDEEITEPAQTLSQFWSGKYEAVIPRSKPLSPGEILGCTAPKLDDVDALM